MLSLFKRDHADLRRFLLGQDVVYVGGGNTAKLLALWRLHGLDTILREALASGVMLAGLSAGMNCWFEASVTDSFGGDGVHPLADGLGLLGGSACPHYDGGKLALGTKQTRGFLPTGASESRESSRSGLSASIEKRPPPIANPVPELIGPLSQNQECAQKMQNPRD